MLRLVCLLLLASYVRCEDDVDDPDVYVLTAKNFHDIVDKEPLMLVEFYAPWCGHCKRLAPEFAKAATTLLAEDPPIKLGKVDATQENDLAEKHAVRGYPTLKVFRNGVPTDYSGPRDANGIVNYMRKQSGPSSVEVTNVEGLDKIIARGETVVAGFFSASGAQSKAFLAAADSLREKFKFAHSFAADVNAHYKHNDAVVIFKPFGEAPAVNEKPGSASSVLEGWIYDNNLPLAGIFTKDNADLYRRVTKPVLKVFVDVDYQRNKKQMDYFLNRLRKVAKELPEVSYAIADRKEWQQDQAKFGLTGKEPNAVVIENLTSQEKFKSEVEKFTVENVRSFVKDFNDGKIKAYIKSEPVPEPAKAGEVAVVVGENFKDIVLDPTKDVMIEFYAPWCGHCKSLAPTYDKLANEFKDVDSVVIAKIDATANDSPHPAYTAHGYPTIYFAPANAKDKPISYDGERDLAAMKKWIKQKASIPISKK